MHFGIADVVVQRQSLLGNMCAGRFVQFFGLRAFRSPHAIVLYRDSELLCRIKCHQKCLFGFFAWVEPVPYRIFHERLEQQGGNGILRQGFPRIAPDGIGETFAHPAFFQFEIQLQHIQFFFYRNDVLTAVLQDSAEQYRKIIQVLYGIFFPREHHQVFQGIQAVEDKMGIHLRT